MDIWAWFTAYRTELAKAGERRLASDLRRLPHLVVNNRHDEVDRLVPTLLAVARNRRHRWLEIFVRHWSLQSRVLKRYEVDGQLPEAVALLDFANQEDTKSCPQSICVVQDLAQCYAQTDGPGYAAERLEVSAETLERIDPTWPCFRCISSEYAGALLDQGRYEETLDYCQQQSERMPPDERNHAYRHCRVEAMMVLGRVEEALAFNQQAHNALAGEGWVLNQRIDTSRLLSELGRFDEALEALPKYEAIADTSSCFVDWTDAALRLARAGAVDNDWSLDLKLLAFASKLERNGAVRKAVRLNQLRGEAALERRRPWIARHALEAMQRVAARLERPLDAPERVAELSAAIERSSEDEPPLFESPEDALDKGGNAPDLDYRYYQIALERWPTNERLWLEWADAASELDRESEMVASGQAFLERTSSDQVVISVGCALVDQGAVDEADAWARRTLDGAQTSSSRAAAYFIQALVADARGDRVREKELLESSVAADPSFRHSRQALALAARTSGEYDRMLEHVTVLLQDSPEDSELHWQRIIAATLLNDWESVRASAAALDLTFETEEGPIWENFGRCRIKLRSESGDSRTMVAIRTGPVTAQIIQISDPNDPDQLYSTEVVFNPEALNPPDPDDDDPPLLIFDSIDVHSPGWFWAFIVDGVRPSPQQMQTFRDQLRDLGGTAQVRSSSDYRISNDSDEELDGQYWFVAVPKDADAEPFESLLCSLAAQLDGPIVWPQLCEALGYTDKRAEQQKLIDQWALL